MATTIGPRRVLPSPSAQAVENPSVAMAKTILEKEGYQVTKTGPGRSFTGFLKSILDSWSDDRQAKAKAQESLADIYKTSYQIRKSNGVSKSAMGENSGTAGGYLVPMDFTYRLLKTIAEESFIYPRATIIPMESSELRAPLVDVTQAQAANASPFFGGITYTWGSSQTPTETEPKFQALPLRAWDLLGYAKLSNQFLADIGPRGEDYLISIFGKAAAWSAEYAFLRGTGTAQQMPLGILNAPASIQLTRNTSSHIKSQDIAGMVSNLLPSSFRNAIWACSPSALSDITQTTTYVVNSWVHGPGDCLGYLCSLPLYVTEKLPALGTTGDLVLFDPSLYVIGDRQEVLIDISDQNLFNTYQTVFRVWLRLDGKPQLSASAPISAGGDLVSGYVVLN